MSVSGSPFCEHKKLRMTCAACRPSPSRQRDPDEPVGIRRGPAAAPKPAAAAPAKTPARVLTDEPAKAPRATGPGKPLMPTKARKKAPTRAEAENAEAWWTKK